jgi:NADH-quinone oxidoreductase subunit J
VGSEMCIRDRYLGAVMVLFLFVVMMLDINIDIMRKGFWKHFPLAATLGAIVALEMAAVLLSGFRVSQAPAMLAGAVPVDNSKALGILLYTEYLMPIQIAASILLVAMIAAIALTLRERKDSKAIDASLQVKVRAADRMQVVKMDATQPAPAPAAPVEESK